MISGCKDTCWFWVRAIPIGCTYGVTDYLLGQYTNLDPAVYGGDNFVVDASSASREP
jgi:hypothetical protein